MRVALGVAILSVAGMSCGALSQEGATSSPVQQSAGVRIVRLSEVRGTVELDRHAGRGYEPGFLNLPIVQGSRLRTKEMAWAEVEFEDNSTLRITPATAVEFPILARDAAGQTRNAVSLLEGTLYVSRIKGDPADFIVKAVDRTLTLGPGSHIRLDVYSAGSELVVVKGTVQVVDASGQTTEVDHRHALKFGGSAPAQLVLSRDEAPGLYDRWDAAATEYHGAKLTQGVSQYGYGTHDLQYYGSFSTLDGCGRVWRPHLASAGFDPAASGVWAWYPGTGYAFVSPYQWGWTTFNSGSWVSCGAAGWGWRPGSWAGLKNHGIVEPIHGPGHRPRPAEEPAAGEPTLQRAGDRVVPRSEVLAGLPVKMVNDSAGLGVPRGSVENLKEISKAVALDRVPPAAQLTDSLVKDSPLFAMLLAKQNEVPARTANGVLLADGPRVRAEVPALQGRPVLPVSVAERVDGFGGSGGYGGRTGSGSALNSTRSGWSSTSGSYGGGRSGGGPVSSGSSNSGTSSGASGSTNAAGAASAAHH